MRVTLKLLSAIAILILLGALWMWDKPTPYERPRGLTGEEKFRLYEATYKVGRYRMNYDNQLITITYEMGGTRKIRRG